MRFPVDGSVTVLSVWEIFSRENLHFCPLYADCRP